MLNVRRRKLKNEIFISMKSLIKKLLREGLLKEDYVSQSQLNNLEQELDNLFKSVGIDIEFTPHFIKRVNDERNGKEITIEELRNIFKAVYAQYKNKLTKYKSGFEAVFKNFPTNINIPFLISWDKKNDELDLINKTVMRKKNFQTPNPVLPVTGEEPKAPEQRTDKFKKLKLPNGKVVRYYEILNKFETLEGTPIEIDAIFDALPPELQDTVLTKMG
jgi:hypothetical protein